MSVIFFSYFRIQQNKINSSIQRLEDDIKKPGGRLITVTRNNTEIKSERKLKERIST